MKDKSRVTLIFCTAAYEEKVPLSVTGNSKNLHCFIPLREIRNDLTIAYNNKNNAWFDIDLSVYCTNSLCLSLPWKSTLFLILQICSLI